MAIKHSENEQNGESGLLNSVSTEELENILKERRAKEQVRTLVEKDLPEFRRAVANTNDLETLAKLARNFGQKVYQVQRYLHPPVEKKEKKTSPKGK